MKKNSILAILLISFMFLGALSKFLLPFSLLGYVIISFFMAFLDKTKNEEVPIILVILLIFQNFCIGLGAHLGGNTDESLKYLTQFPFISIFIIWIVNFFKKDTHKINIRKSFYLYLFFILISFIQGYGGLVSILVCLRNLLTFYMAYEIGYLYLDTKDKRDKFCKSFLKITPVLLILGIIIMVGGFDFYCLIGFKEVYIAKAAPVIGDEIKGRFYTKLFYSYIPRMGSILYEPINLAYFFSFGMYISFFYNRLCEKKWIMNFLINLIGLVLTVGKGGFFVFGIVLLLFSIEKYFKIFLKKINNKHIFRMSILVIILLLYIFISFYLKKFPSSSVVPHFWGIVDGFNSIISHPMGFGIGTGGNMAFLTNKNALNNGSESGLITIFYQIGILGGFTLIYIFNKLVNINNQQNAIYKAAYFLAWSILITSLFQENTYGPQCITYFMLFLGSINHELIGGKNEKIYS